MKLCSCLQCFMLCFDAYMSTIVTGCGYGERVSILYFISNSICTTTYDFLTLRFTCKHKSYKWRWWVCASGAIRSSTPRCVFPLRLTGAYMLHNVIKSFIIITKLVMAVCTSLWLFEVWNSSKVSFFFFSTILFTYLILYFQVIFLVNVMYFHVIYLMIDFSSFHYIPSYTKMLNNPKGL